jgi:hypothetical protein
MEEIRRVDSAGKFTVVKSVEKGIGAKMLRYANWLLSTIYVVEREEGRPKLDEYGSVIFVRNADGTPQEGGTANAKSKTRLNRFVGLIDGARQVGEMFGDGPF